MSFTLEQDFYNCKKGFPLEDPLFAGFSIGCGLKEFDSFGIITNSYPMYVRVFPLRSGCQDGHCISKEGRYANLDSNTRDEECPKIAWGFSAFIFRNLSVMINGEVYNSKYHNYIINQDEDINFYIDEIEAKNHYRELLWKDYCKIQAGIKFRDVSEKDKLLSFLEQHYNDELKFWKRTEPVLKNYLCPSSNPKAGKLLYDYIEDITEQYCKDIKRLRNTIQYKWLYHIIEFVKKNTLKILSGLFAALLAYIYKDTAVAIYHYIHRLLERF